MGPAVGSGAGVGVSGGCRGAWESYDRVRSGFGVALCDWQGGAWLMDPGKGGIEVRLCRLLRLAQR